MRFSLLVYLSALNLDYKVLAPISNIITLVSLTSVAISKCDQGNEITIIAKKLGSKFVTEGSEESVHDCVTDSGVKDLFTEFVANATKTDCSVNQDQQDRDEDSNESDGNEGHISDGGVADSQNPRQKSIRMFASELKSYFSVNINYQTAYIRDIRIF